MKLAIVGSRHFTDTNRFDKWIKESVDLWGTPEEVVSGGARGADTLGEKWAQTNDIPTTIYKPDWIRYGKRAGIIRNVDIITRATHVVAFPSKTGKGTQHSISLAEEQGKKLLVYWID
jgi:hypothetical protein